MSSHLRHLFYIGSREKFPEPVVNAVVRELPNLDVQILSDWETFVGSVDRESSVPTLILIEEAYGAANIDVLKNFQEQYPNAVLCLTFNGEYKSKQHIRECLKSGIVSNVVPMNLRLDLWLFAVQIMLRGGSYIPPELVELLEIDRSLQLEKVRKTEEDGSGNGAKYVGSLTPREREVLALIARGQPNKNIAANLSLSEHTVKLHIHHIISKMGVSNRTEAAAAFLQIQDVNGVPDK